MSIGHFTKPSDLDDPLSLLDFFDRLDRDHIPSSFQIDCIDFGHDGSYTTYLCPNRPPETTIMSTGDCSFAKFDNKAERDDFAKKLADSLEKVGRKVEIRPSRASGPFKGQFQKHISIAERSYMDFREIAKLMDRMDSKDVNRED